MQTEKVRNRNIEEVFKLEKPIGDMNEIEISVQFVKGGMNFMSGGSHPTSYRISCSPCQRTTHTLDNGETYTSRQSVMLSGKRDSGLAYRICETARYSEKTLKALALQVKAEQVAKWYEEENDTAIQEYIKTLKV